MYVEYMQARRAADLSKTEMKVLDFIMEKTIGYRKQEDDISKSQFFNATCLRSDHLSTALKGLIAKGLIEVFDGRYGLICRIPDEHWSAGCKSWLMDEAKASTPSSTEPAIDPELETEFRAFMAFRTSILPKIRDENNQTLGDVHPKAGESAPENWLHTPITTTPKTITPHTTTDNAHPEVVVSREAIALVFEDQDCKQAEVLLKACPASDREAVLQIVKQGVQAGKVKTRLGYLAELVKRANAGLLDKSGLSAPVPLPTTLPAPVPVVPAPVPKVVERVNLANSLVWLGNMAKALGKSVRETAEMMAPELLPHVSEEVAA
ncbi:MAG: Bacteriophage replication protein [Pseudomonadota bacterium]|jgi:phage replication O-like protein O